LEDCLCHKIFKKFSCKVYRLGIKDAFNLENEEMGKEIFNMKHEMISMQAQLEALEEKMKVLEEEKKKAEHDVIRLETELGNKPGKK